MIRMRCSLCAWVSGVPDLSSYPVRYMIHMIDEHWGMVERIRATSGDPDGRDALNAEVEKELSGS